MVAVNPVLYLESLCSDVGTMMIDRLVFDIAGQGLHDITERVRAAVDNANIVEGLCTLYLRHTSASLLIQENYDSAVKKDLQNWLNRPVPEGDSLYTHTLEGADDMPAHLKTALTAVSISIPVLDGKLALGTWQGIFLWEHRTSPQRRDLVLHLL